MRHDPGTLRLRVAAAGSGGRGDALGDGVDADVRDAVAEKEGEDDCDGVAPTDNEGEGGADALLAGELVGVGGTRNKGTGCTFPAVRGTE